MSEWLRFRQFITPTVVQILFWFGIAFSIIAGLSMLVAGEEAGDRVAGLVVLVIGPLIVRVYSELIILMFRIYDELRAMRKDKIGGAV